MDYVITQSEAYENGHFAGSYITTGPMPPWAKLLNCQHGGFWVYLNVGDFIKGCRHMNAIEDKPGNVFMEVVEFTSDISHYPHFIKSLEKLGLNMMAHAAYNELECFGGTFAATQKGTASIAGLFRLNITLEGTDHVHHYQFQGELRFPHHPFNYAPVSKSMVVGHFKVPIMPTMDPFMAMHGLVEDDHFSEQISGFFEPLEVKHRQKQTTSTRSWSMWGQKT